MPARQRIGIVGAGGHGLEVLWTVDRINASGKAKWDIVGFFERPAAAGGTLRGHPILAEDAIRECPGIQLAAAIGWSAPRRRVVESIEQRFPDVPWATLIDPAAIITEGDVSLGDGCMLLAGCVLTVNIQLGRHVHVGRLATIGHESQLGDFATLTPGAALAGNVVIGPDTFVGSKATIIEGVHVGARCTVGAGAAVIGNLEDDVTACGVPARPRKNR